MFNIENESRIEAEDYDTGDGVSKQPTEDETGDQNIGWIDNGDFVAYDLRPEPGTYTVQLRLASPNTGRQVVLSYGDEDVATVNVPETGGWQAWETVDVPGITLEEQSELRLTFVGGGVNVNWIGFAQDADTDEESPTQGYGSTHHETYAIDFAGETLAQKVGNAVASLDNGSGRVRITPPADSSSWDWNQTLALNCEQLNGVELDIDDNLPINFDVDGAALVVNNTPTTNNHPGSESRLKLVGGRWYGSDTSGGWLRIKDAIGCEIHPNIVRVHNDTHDAFGIQVENHASYSESLHASGRIETDRGIDFLPQSITGGDGGTDSFHDTYLENLHINARDFCMRLRGRFMYGSIINPSLFCKRDGATGLILDAPRMDGTAIVGAKFESPGNYDDTTAIHKTGEYEHWYGPSMHGGYVGYGIDNHETGYGGVAQFTHRFGANYIPTNGRPDNIIMEDQETGDKYRVSIKNGELTADSV